MASVRHHFFGRIDVQTRSTILLALEHAGITTSAVAQDTPEGPCILFFNEITRELYHVLRALSANGRERVLAIALLPDALAGGYAWHLLQSGASDAFDWNHSMHPAEEVAARFERWNDVDRLLESPLTRNTLVGQSPIWLSVLRQIVEVARYTEASILITGESGTGKELVAHLVHALDPRAQKRDLVILDCTTIVPELSGSEFFGHERGAFTGAVATRTGAFALADGGTLFLDEVGELPLGLQAQLLRVVQERTFKIVGGNTWQRTDFRLICATNRDLLEQVGRGRFRHDLYYRIANWVCKLPPLRERGADILPMVHHFLRQLQPNQQPLGLDEPVRAYLLQREYPGNARDLKQLVSRLYYRHVGAGPITVGDIPDEERPAAEFEAEDWRDAPFEHAIRRALALGVGLKEIGRAVTDMAIQIAVSDAAGNLQRAARSLGVTDRALQLRRATHRQHSLTQDDTSMV
jgi:transcriptional regulator with GAF, ATPase, and Fis domain